MNNVTMRDLFELEKTEGEVGIEVEVEGRGLRHVKPTPTWRVEHDGSLRGEANEFVLKKPCTRDLIRKRLLQFKRMIKGVEIVDSPRAGIHVHINVQELDQREVTQFIVLYMIFEDMLVDWCGDSRVGNLFCLRTRDAGGMLHLLRNVIKSDVWYELRTDGIRYASLNLKALPHYGSLEFRAMRSTTEVETIEEWANILLALKDEALKYEAPHEIVERMSFENPEAFFERVLGFSTVKYNQGSMMDGVRMAQVIAYARTDWEGKKEENLYDMVEGGARPERVFKVPNAQMKFREELHAEFEGDMVQAVAKPARTLNQVGANTFEFFKGAHCRRVNRDTLKSLVNKLHAGRPLTGDQTWLAQEYMRVVERAAMQNAAQDVHAEKMKRGLNRAAKMANPQGMNDQIINDMLRGIGED